MHAAQLAELLEQPDACEFSPATVTAVRELVRELEQQCFDARIEFDNRFAEYDSPATEAALALVVAEVRNDGSTIL